MRTGLAKAQTSAGEQQLCADCRHLKSILDQSLDVIYRRDLAGNRCDYVSKAAEHVMGFTPDELMAMSLDDAVARIHPDDRKTIDAMMPEVVHRGSGRLEYRWLHKDGTWRWLSDQLTVTTDGAGRPIRHSGVARDITERRAAEETLRRAKADVEKAGRAKDHFLAVLSHELRTPLTPVLMLISEHLRDAALPKDLRDDLEIIRRNVELEIHLIDDLLDINRIARGKLVMQPAAVELRDVIAQAASICSAEARDKGLELILDTGPDPLPILGDAARLQQVFWNLIKNAVKFTSSGQVRITARLRDGRAVITTTDTGAGIDPEVLSRLFVAFEQGGIGITRRFGGLGLGLAICHALLEIHGGTIAAHSDGKGLGATFTVELPLTSEPPTRPEPAPRGTGTTRKPHARILLVEDHQDSANALARILRRWGHTVSIAGDVCSALEHASSERPDILISDIGLPDGSGVDLMRQLRQARPEIRGIALSGHGMEADLQSSHEAGFCAHLVKPVEPRRLEQAIAELL